MRIRIIRHVKDQLSNPGASRGFMDFVEMRQRLFEAQFSKALCLDRYDLISDHITVYSDEGLKQPVAYLRSTPSDTCQFYGVPMPIVASVAHLPEHAGALAGFLSQVDLAFNMGFLCLDTRHRAALEGIKVIDLLTWVAFQAGGATSSREPGLCCTLNSKFHQLDWLRKLGPVTGDLPEFEHPVIPEPHQLVLIPKVLPEYWKEQERSYRELLTRAEWLVPGAAPLKRAA